MTEQELEVIRINLRIEVLKVLVGALYSMLARRTPTAAQGFLETFRAIREDHSRVSLKGLPPEYSDLIAGEYQDALNEILGEIEALIRKNA